MSKIKAFLARLGLTKKLYGCICLLLLAGALCQWVAPIAGQPIARAYAYQYGLFSPWLHIYKTADMGSLHLFQALFSGGNLGNEGLSWVINGSFLVDALGIWACIGLARCLFPAKAKKIETPQSH